MLEITLDPSGQYLKRLYKEEPNNRAFQNPMMEFITGLGIVLDWACEYAYKNDTTEFIESFLKERYKFPLYSQGGFKFIDYEGTLSFPGDLPIYPVLYVSLKDQSRIILYPRSILSVKQCDIIDAPTHVFILD